MEGCYSYDVAFRRRASWRKDKMGQEGHGFVGGKFLRLQIKGTMHPVWLIWPYSRKLQKSRYLNFFCQPQQDASPTAIPGRRDFITPRASPIQSPGPCYEFNHSICMRNACQFLHRYLRCGGDYHVTRCPAPTA